MATKRDYSYDTAYENRPEQVKHRMERNRARALMEKKGVVHKGDGKDVDHIKTLKDGGKTTPGNLRVLSASKNRARKT
jgi:hypothetical protein